MEFCDMCGDEMFFDEEWTQKHAEEEYRAIFGTLEKHDKGVCDECHQYMLKCMRVARWRYDGTPKDVPLKDLPESPDDVPWIHLIDTAMDEVGAPPWARRARH
jgi:hypothetical protein